MNDEITEARLKRRRRIRMKRLRGFLIIMALMVLAVLGVNSITKSTFSDIGDYFKSFFAEASGYPCSLGNSLPKKVCEMDSAYAVLTTDELIIKSGKGSELLRISHNLVAADIDSKGNRTLMYNRGSKDAYVYNRTSLLTELTAESPIVDGAISKNGTLALLTESERYLCQLEIYKNGMYDNIMTWYSSEGFPVMCSVSDKGTKAAAACVNLIDGSVQSIVTMIDVSSSSQRWSVTISGIIYEMKLFSDGKMLVITDEGAYNISSNGEVISSLDFKFTPVMRIAFGNSSFAIAFGDNMRNTENYIDYYDYSFNHLFRAEECGTVKDILYTGKSVVVLGDGVLTEYNMQGASDYTAKISRDVFRIVDYNDVILLSPQTAERFYS